MATTGLHAQAVTRNYSAQVVDAIPEIVKNFSRQGMREDAETLRAWSGMIQRAVKFSLPISGDFFTKGKGLPAGVFPQRLPYPLLALEVPHVVDHIGGTSSSRRLILCQEMNLSPKGSYFEIDNAPKDPEGFSVSVFSYIDKGRQWVPQPCSAYVRYDESTISHDQIPEGTATYINERRRQQASFQFRKIPLLTQLWERAVMQQGRVAADQAFARDTAEEVRIAFEFLQVLRCRNVREVEYMPSPALNAKRQRNGKALIDTFRVLMIGDVLIGRPSGKYEFSGAYKVREHYRSGHIRRLGDQSVWVSDTIVAAGSHLGMAQKHYAVRA
jgi:hypothetical protein